MLSETSSKLVEKIHCKMVQVSIPVKLCSTEQGTIECAGCSASTRRCSVCNKPRGIIEPVKGICGHCVEKAEKRRPAGGEATDHSSEHPLARVKRLGELQVVADEVETVRANSRSRAEPTHVSHDAEFIYALLIEHRQQKSDDWLVAVPLTVLKRRLHLMQDEALEALKRLAGLGMIKGDEPWEKIILLKCEAFDDQEPDHVAYRRRRDHRSQTDAIGVRANNYVSKVKRGTSDKVRVFKTISPESGTASPAQQTLSTVPIRTKKSPAPSHFYRDLYDHLISRSNLLRNERLVGGAMPMLQIRFKLSPLQAKQALEWLEENGHVRQKDQWRTIILISSSVLSDEGLVTGATMRKLISQIKPPDLTPVMDQSRASTRAHVPPPLKAEEIRTPQIVFTELVADLESTLVSLRKKRDDLGLQVAQLEAGLIALKAFQDQLGTVAMVADESLAEAIKAVQKLFSALRG